MVKRNYIPVCLNGRPHRIFVDDLINIHQTKKIIKPKLPKYVHKDEVGDEEEEDKINEMSRRSSC